MQLTGYSVFAIKREYNSIIKGFVVFYANA